MNKKLVIGVASSLLLFAGCAVAENQSMNKNDSMGMHKSKEMNMGITVKHLTDAKGMALYTFDKDTKNKSNCYNGCEAKWPVFNADIKMLTLPMGISKDAFGTIKRNNGAIQTTYKSKPLYYFFKDSKPKDTNGNLLKGVWHLIELNK